MPSSAYVQLYIYEYVDQIHIHRNGILVHADYLGVSGWVCLMLRGEN